MSSRWMLWSRMTGGMLGVLGAVLATAATAWADEPPQVTHDPTIVGTAQVGQELQQRDADWTGDEPIDVSWMWLRCTGPAVRDCRSITGANGTSYRPVAADVGRRLRLMLVLSNRDGSEWAVSPPTDAVTPAPEPAPAPPAPVPAPEVTPVATPLPMVFPVTPPAPATPKPAPTMMKPFPVIRIRGELTPRGAKVSLLTVKAPKGAAIRLRCFGRSCPVDKWAHAASITRIFAFQKRLRAGTRIVITVTRRNRIGKHTTFVIRKGKPPKRVDRCLYPGAKKPTKCGAT